MAGCGPYYVWLLRAVAAGMAHDKVAKGVVSRAFVAGYAGHAAVRQAYTLVVRLSMADNDMGEMP